MLGQLFNFMPVPSIERKQSVEKNRNQFNRGDDQQFDDAIWHFPMLLGSYRCNFAKEDKK